MINPLPKEDEPQTTQLYSIPPQDAESWVALGNTYYVRGNLDEAGECCQRALALQPDHLEAIVGSGNVLLSQGKHDEAATLYQRAIAINPLHAVAHCNLGNIHSMLGEYDEAAGRFQKAMQLDPNLFIAFYNLGNLRMRQGAYDKAANNFRRAIILHPSEEQLNHVKQQGLLMMKSNQLQAARGLFSQLCQTRPEDMQAWLQLSTINAKLGNLDEAGDCCRHVLTIEPNNDQAHVVLGNIRFNHRQLEGALFHYQRALEINPQNITALNNFGNACQTEQQISRYFEFYRAATALVTDPYEARATFGKLLMKFLPPTYAQWLDDELQGCFAMSGFDDKFLSRAASHLLKLKYNIHPSMHMKSDALSKMGEKIASDSLFILFLERTVNLDATLEEYLIELRRELLTWHSAGNDIGPKELRLITALAHQSFNNEYVFTFDPWEEQVVNRLRRAIEQSVPAVHRPDEDLERELLIFAMYESLYSLDCREYLGLIPRMFWSTNFGPLLDQAILNPIEEEAIKRNIATTGRIEDSTSRLVQSQYEANPYPRWLSVRKDRSRNLKLMVKQMFPDFTTPAFLDGPVRILIAGCGTGKHPIQTAAYDNVEITAVDISKSSLAYAIRMARKFGVTNVRFIQGDILELSGLDTRFHIIECVGVLHHMEDPLAGWRILNDLLVEGGLMSVGLYSELGRRPISAAREIISNECLAPDRQNIRCFRQRVLQREPGDLLYDLRYFSDFYSTSECRDLLFHFTEHRYTLTQLSDSLHELNLDFLGFIFDDLKIPNLYHSHFPQDKKMKNFSCWDQLERLYPNIFSGMYKFWCQKPPRNGA